MSRSCVPSPSLSPLIVTSLGTFVIIACPECTTNDGCRVIVELKRRFAPFLKEEDDSLIPADLLRPTFIHVGIYCYALTNIY